MYESNLVPCHATPNGRRCKRHAQTPRAKLESNFDWLRGAARQEMHLVSIAIFQRVLLSITPLAALRFALTLIRDRIPAALFQNTPSATILRPRRVPAIRLARFWEECTRAVRQHPWARRRGDQHGRGGPGGEIDVEW